MSEDLRITNLEELKRASISMSEPIQALYLVDDLDPKRRIHVFDPTYDLEEVHHCFRELYGVIAFIDEEEVMYAVPACDVVREIMAKHQFIPDLYMKVPFIFYDVPLLEMDKWCRLLDWKFKMESLECSGS